MPIVCGTDFSERAAHALSAAGALAARRREAELWLVHVLDRASTQSLDALEWDQLKTKTDERLQADAKRLRERYSLRHVYALTLVGTAGIVLSDFARIKRASLIVVASQEREASPLFRVGSTCEEAALSSSVPVLVVHDAAPFEAWSRGERPLRLLLDVDWTRTSAAALSLVKALRAAGPCDVVVVGEHASEGSAAHHLVPAQDLATYVGELGGEGTLVHQSVASDGQLAAHLMEAAAAHAADLIVIGRHRHAWLRRLGAAPSHLLQFARVAVMCVPAIDAPAQCEPRFTRRVLVATDLSSASHAAVTVGYGLLAEHGGEVQLLHVARGGPAANTTALLAELRELVPLWAAGRGILTQLEVLESPEVVAGIVDAAARFDADVICVGTHGRSGLGRLLLGSVAEHVVRNSARPVLLVRPLPA